MNLYFHSLSAGHCKHWKRKNNNSPSLNIALAPSTQSLSVGLCMDQIDPFRSPHPMPQPLVSALGAWGDAGWYSREQTLLGLYELSVGHQS